MAGRIDFVLRGAGVVAVAGVLAGGGTYLVGDGGLPPDRTSDCFSQPGACGFPDPDYGNVGVPDGVTLTPSGGLTINTPGTIIDALDITGTSEPLININADNVTIKRSRITANTGDSEIDGLGDVVIETCEGCHTTFEDVEFTTTSGTDTEFFVHTVSGEAITPDTQTYTRVYQHGNVDNFAWTEGSLTVTDTYSIIGESDGAGGWETAIPGDHIENTYINDATINIDHVTFLNPVPQTATIFNNTQNGDGGACSNHTTITDSLLAGGGYITYPCGNASSVGTATSTITGNRIARCGGGAEVAGGGGTWLCSGLTISHDDGEGYYPRGGSFGQTSGYFAASFSWSGNVWDENDATIPEP